MKIAIVERSIAAFGGRQITLVDAFLSCFKEMGHTVKFYTQFTDRRVISRENFINYFLSKNINDSDFVFTDLKSRSILARSLMRDKYDLIFTSAGFNSIASLVKCPVISWVIAKTNIDKRAIVWTNSKHQKSEIGISRAQVIYPPHDYSLFRQKCKEWKKRNIDVLIVTAITKRKYRECHMQNLIEQIERIYYKERLNIVGIFLARSKQEKNFVKKLSFETYMNLSRHEVAKIMGNSKIFYHPSPDECAALVIYEALNGGCYPVVQRAGACEEQMENVGIIYDRPLNVGFWRWIKEDIIDKPYDINFSVGQGQKFDRKKIKSQIEKLLISYVGKTQS